MLLVFDFCRWHGAVGLVLALVLSPLAVASGCFESTGDEVTLSGSCTKANTTLFVNGTEQSLNFKLNAKNGAALTKQQIKLAIGKCDFTGELSYGSGGTDSIRLTALSDTAPELPVNGKADSNGVEITKNSKKYKAATCSSKFEQVEGGYKVSIVYDSNNVILPDFKITFENAHLYVPPINEADWSYKGWRLRLYWEALIKVRKNKEAQLEGGGQTKSKSTAAKSTDKSTAKSKSFLKKKSKSAAKAVDGNSWIKTFAWPTRKYRTEDIDYLIMRLDVPNPPIRQLLELHPLNHAQREAFNEWAIAHHKICAMKDEMQLSPELYNRLMAECRVIYVIIEEGVKMGVAKRGQPEPEKAI